MKIKILFLMVFTLLVISPVVWADGTEVELILGNTVIPIQNNNVRMVSERVEISDETGVVALFEFENLSDKNVTMKMGFPFPRGDNYPDFKVWVQKIPATVNKGEMYEKSDIVMRDYLGFAFNMYFWDVSFSARERRKIKVKYSGEWAAPIHGNPAGYFIYITKTGSLWGGSIGKADFYMQLPKGIRYLLSDEREHHRLSIKPEGYVIKGNQIEWHFTDWKPKGNIGVALVKNEEGEKLFLGILHRSEQIGVISRNEALAEQKAIKICKGYFDKKKYEGDKRYYTLDDIEAWRQVLMIGNDDSKEIIQRIYVKALRNEIYARHGRFFNTQDMRQIFESAPWYKRRPPAHIKRIESELNAIEKKNVFFIFEYEKKMGWQ